MEAAAWLQAHPLMTRTTSWPLVLNNEIANPGCGQGRHFSLAILVVILMGYVAPGTRTQGPARARKEAQKLRYGFTTTFK